MMKISVVKRRKLGDMPRHINYTCTVCKKETWAYAGHRGCFVKCKICGTKSKVPDGSPVDDLTNATCGNCERPHTLIQTEGGVWCNWCNKLTCQESPESTKVNVEACSDSQERGYVYILVNSMMMGLVKIGKTQDDPETRATDLYVTGVPVPFVVAYSVLVGDHHEVERKIHSELSKYRVNDKREFFQIDTATAINVLREIAQCHPLK